MAVNFKKGEVVQVSASDIQGPVLDITLNRDYVLLYLISYTNTEGVEHKRWFKEAQLSRI